MPCGARHSTGCSSTPTRSRPRPARRIAPTVDGGVIGPPPRAAGTTRLYLSGPGAADVAGLFSGSPLDARVVDETIGSASALKMTYAAYTKGMAALLLALREVSRFHGVDDTLLAEWAISQPQLAGHVRVRHRELRAQGVALDLGDGGDRGDVRGRGSTGRIPPCRGRGLPIGGRPVTMDQHALTVARATKGFMPEDEGLALHEAGLDGGRRRTAAGDRLLLREVRGLSRVRRGPARDRALHDRSSSRLGGEPGRVGPPRCRGRRCPHRSHGHAAVLPAHDRRRRLGGRRRRDRR